MGRFPPVQSSGGTLALPVESRTFLTRLTAEENIELIDPDPALFQLLPQFGKRRLNQRSHLFSLSDKPGTDHALFRRHPQLQIAETFRLQPQVKRTPAFEQLAGDASYHLKYL